MWVAVLQELEAVMKQQGVQHPALESDISEQLLSDVLSQTQVALDRIKIEQPPQSATVAQPLAASSSRRLCGSFSSDRRCRCPSNTDLACAQRFFW